MANGAVWAEIRGFHRQTWCFLRISEFLGASGGAHGVWRVENEAFALHTVNKVDGWFILA